MSCATTGCPGWSPSSFPVIWQVVQNETWSPIGGGLVRGEVSIAAHGAPGSGLGTALLAPAQNGSRLKCTATVEFKVPLVGGKIESFIGRQMAQQILCNTALHREVDHGACLTPVVLRCGQHPCVGDRAGTAIPPTERRRDRSCGAVQFWHYLTAARYNRIWTDSSSQQHNSGSANGWRRGSPRGSLRASRLARFGLERAPLAVLVTIRSLARSVR